MLLIKRSSFPLLTSWHYDIEASVVITQGWRSGRDTAALAQHQAEAGFILFKRCRYFPLQKSGFVSSCLQAHLQSILRFGLFLFKLKGDSKFYWLQTPISSGAAATVAVNWSQLKAESLSYLSFTNVPKAVDGAQGITSCELFCVRVVPAGIVPFPIARRTTVHPVHCPSQSV